MASYWDVNDTGANKQEDLRYFYEEFSSSVRKRLISRNLIAPTNIYDVLYPKTRQDLISRNTPKFSNLEESSTPIRNALISKLVSESTDLEKMSENSRKSLLARNKILQDANDLINKSNSYRTNNISKNVPVEGDIFKGSEEFRTNNISKNDENANQNSNIDSTGEEFRLNNIAKNVKQEGDLLSDSNSFLKNNISHNVSETGDLLTDSKSFLANNVSANVEKVKDLLESSTEFLKNNISPNVPKSEDLLSDSMDFLKNNVSHNVAKATDIQSDSESFLKNNISHNIKKDSDLETDSTEFLKNNVSHNVSSSSDIETSSLDFLKSNVSHNKSKDFDILTESKTFLESNISNNVKKVGDLEIDSVEFLKNNVSSNIEKNSNLEADSKEFLKNNVSSNKSNGSNLEVDSKEFLKNNVSTNVPSISDLQTDSKDFLQNNISANKPDGGDLLTDSASFLANNVSTNVSKAEDLLSESSGFLHNNISANIPKVEDLLTDSTTFLANNLAGNIPKVEDLLTDSTVFLANNISPNVPSNEDLLTDSAVFLTNNLASNIPSNEDLLVDSAPFLLNNIISNVSANEDLLVDSATFLANNIAGNVPSTENLIVDSAPFLSNNLAGNVPSTENLIVDSIPFLNNNIAGNVAFTHDLLTDSAPFLANNIAVNSANATANNFDLQSYSNAFRINNLKANPTNTQMGEVIEGFGTSAFIGVSKVLAMGILFRQLSLIKNDYRLGGNEYNQGDVNGDGNSLAKSNGVTFRGTTTSDEINEQIKKIETFGSSSKYIQDKTSASYSDNLQLKYGTSNYVDNQESRVGIGGGMYSVNNSPKGGGFSSFSNSATKLEYIKKIYNGTVTDGIRNYNISRNLYNLQEIEVGSPLPGSLTSGVNGEEFDDLIEKTIGSFGQNSKIGLQLKGNLNPNNGPYIQGATTNASIENILRPEGGFSKIVGLNPPIGAAESMMSKTVAGNPLMDEEFRAGKKGVKYVINTIRSTSKIGSFGKNFDPQNAKKFIIGSSASESQNGGKVARQRFTISNPYSPGSAQKLMFYLKNYSSNEAFYLPPYIQSYSDSYGASWNSVNFLGRPEPIFTYNNSTREGNISFIVLTDYSQKVLIGRDYNSDFQANGNDSPDGQTRENGVEAIINKHFTSNDISKNNENNKSTRSIDNINKKIQEKNKEIQDYKQKQSELIAESGKFATLALSKDKNSITADSTAGLQDISNNDKSKSDTLDKTISDLQSEINSLLLTKEGLNATINSSINSSDIYSETQSNISNVYTTEVVNNGSGTEIDSKPLETLDRINSMVAGLMFQPAFFSGDKIDFTRKMEFLAKMTRPSKAEDGSGFSFTKPPVCRIKLGTWWDNDIVVDSVGFNYDGVPWTQDDGGTTQPMWAVVTMSFKFIGAYGGQSGGPVLSDDNGGLYKSRTA